MARALPLLLTLTLLSRVAAAQEDIVVVEARQRFDRGVEALARGDFRAAHGEFQRAYQLRPHPSLLINLANCELRLDRNLDAARHFEQFLREATDAPAAQRRDAEASLQRARSKLGAVVFLVTPPGATITFDREPLGQVADGTSVTVAPGRHVARAVLPGHLTAERVVSVSEGERAEVVIDLIPENFAHGRLEVDVDGSQGHAVRLDGRSLGETPWSGDVPVGLHQIAVETPRGTWRGQVDVRESRRVEVDVTTPPPVVDDRDRYALLGGIVAAGLIGGAAVAGVVALGYENGFEESASRIEREDYADDAERAQLRRDGHAAADAAEGFAVASDVMWVGATVLGAATAAYWLLGEPEAPAPTAEVRLARDSGGTWVALGLSGRF